MAPPVWFPSFGICQTKSHKCQLQISREFAHKLQRKQLLWHLRTLAKSGRTSYISYIHIFILFLGIVTTLRYHKWISKGMNTIGCVRVLHERWSLRSAPCTQDQGPRDFSPSKQNARDRSVIRCHQFLFLWGVNTMHIHKQQTTGLRQLLRIWIAHARWEKNIDRTVWVLRHRAFIATCWQEPRHKTGTGCQRLDSRSLCINKYAKDNERREVEESLPA